MAISKITTSGVSADTLTAADLAPNSVDSSELVDGSVDLSHMSANSVDSDQYVDGSIDLVHMSANSVDSDQYVDGSIDEVHLGNLQVTAAKVASDVATTAGTQTLTNKTLTTPDLNGSELILDADADTSITASTDDQVDFKLGGTDTFQLDTAGRFGKFSGVTSALAYGGSHYKSGTSQIYIDRVFHSAGTSWENVFLFTFTSGSWGGFWCEVNHTAQSNGATHDVFSKFHINGHAATTASIVAQYHLARGSSDVANTARWVFGSSPCTAYLQLKHSQGSEQNFTRISLATDHVQTETFGLTWY